VIVIDTHAWLWWTSAPDLLSRTAREAIDHTDLVAISAISCYEAVGLIDRGRVEPNREPRQWLAEAIRIDRIVVLDVDSTIAAEAALLSRDRMRDPIDRVIVATAVHHRLPLITKDEKIRAAGVVQTIW
jgi:PIN domain nuclease of toxin-antitoxin system